MSYRILYILITIVITSYLQTACSSGESTPNLSPGASFEQITSARNSAERLFAQRTDLDKLREAIRLVGAVRDPNKRDYDVEWTYARYSFFLGSHTDNDAEAEKAFTQGKDAAKIAANMNPDRPEGNFWYGANLGQLCKRSPVTVGIRNVDEVRDAMKKVIAVDPGYQGASAYDVLGQIELSTTQIKDGTAEKAVEYLQKALEFERENSGIYVHLAQAYLALNRDAEAKRQLDHVMKMTPSPEYVPEHNDAVKEAKKLLETRFK
jgi:tetratricopeptide (TPR) repeat protein